MTKEETVQFLYQIADEIQSLLDKSPSPKGQWTSQKRLEALSVAISALRDLSQAEQDGRIFPCKPDDIVFEILPDLPLPAVRVVRKVHTAGHKFNVFVENIRTGQKYALSSDDLGKTWFLTREEARAVIEAQRGGKSNDQL